MKATVEISFYPLDEQFKDKVKDIIAQFEQQPGIEVYPGTMSTVLFGELTCLCEAQQAVMQYAFTTYGSAVFVAKTISSDRRPK